MSFRVVTPGGLESSWFGVSEAESRRLRSPVEAAPQLQQLTSLGHARLDAPSTVPNSNLAVDVGFAEVIRDIDEIDASTGHDALLEVAQREVRGGEIPDPASEPLEVKVGSRKRL